MKVFGRRIFARGVPAVGLGALTLGGTRIVMDDSIPTPPSQPYRDYGAGLIKQSLTKLVAPESYKQYEAAQMALSAAQSYRYERQRLLDGRNGASLDLDIQVLKSVSLQHKAAMQIARQDRNRIEERSFFENLAASLGLTEYLKKRYEEPLGGSIATAERAGTSRY